MRKSFCAAVLPILLWSVFVSVASAHSPYFGQSERMSHPHWGDVHFTVLYGDGIFFADPSQVVVSDSQGYLLAATPLSDALLFSCDSSHGELHCRVYDELRGFVFEPDYEQWARGGTIEKDGRPTRYPGHELAYGFTQRPATVIEKLDFLFVRILLAPVATIFSILWWTAAWSFVARLLWHWKRNRWAILPIRAAAVGWGFSSILAFLGMSFVAAYAWFIKPSSDHYLLLVFVAGALIAAILTRPREALQKS
jgi:hypothetical protein